MDLKELVEAVGKLTASIAEQGAKIDALEKKAPDTSHLSASAECMAAVEPHAKAMEAAADGMQKAGIGMHPKMGHVARMRSMANHLRAESAMGNLPHIYRDHDWSGLHAQAETVTDPAITELKASQAKLIDTVASLETVLKDLKAGQQQQTQAPERKTVPPHFMSLLARHGVESPLDSEGALINNESLTASMKKAGIEPEKRIEILRGAERVRNGLPV